MKKSYEYYHNGRTPADDGMMATKKENYQRCGKAPIKIIWMMADQITKIGYCQSREEAERQITNSYNRKWGSAILLFWSDRLGKYVTVPED